MSICNGGINNQLIESIINDKLGEEGHNLMKLQDSMLEFSKILKDTVNVNTGFYDSYQYYVDNIENLKLTDPKHKVVKTRGYYKAPLGASLYTYVEALKGNEIDSIKSSVADGYWVLTPIDNAISPEQVGAVGDGITDDYEALRKAFYSKQPIINFGESRTYLISEPTRLFDDVRIINGNGSKIIYTKEQDGLLSTSNISCFFSADRTKPLYVHDLEIEYTGRFRWKDENNTTHLNYISYKGAVCGFNIKTVEGASNLRFERLEIHGFNRAGIEINLNTQEVYMKDIFISQCHFHHNKVAGIWFAYVENLQFIGNRCEFNGDDLDGGTGYGISGVSWGYPKNIFVAFNTCSDNYRKGIDFHSGYNIFIHNNVCERNRYVGIYSVLRNDGNGSTHNPKDKKPLGMLSITSNKIAFMYNRGDMELSELSGISFGFDGSHVPEAPGAEINTIHVNNNSVTHFDARDGIRADGTKKLVSGSPFSMHFGGFQKLRCEISGNIIDVASCEYLFSWGSSAKNNLHQDTRNLELSVINNTLRSSNVESAFTNTRFPATFMSYFNFSFNFVEVGVTGTAYSNDQFMDLRYDTLTGSFPSKKTEIIVTGNTLHNHSVPETIYHPIRFEGVVKDHIRISSNTYNYRSVPDVCDGVMTSYGDQAPNKGYWTLSSRVYNKVVTPGGIYMWVCTKEGVPGVWAPLKLSTT